MQFTAERARVSDAEALARLRVEAMRPSLEHIGRFDPGRARARFLDSFCPDDTTKLLVGDELVGFYTVISDGAALTLSHLYVRPRFQEHGIGAEVLVRVKAQALEQGLPLRLGALRGSRSNQFYLRHGFRQTHEQQWDIYYQFN